MRVQVDDGSGLTGRGPVHLGRGSRAVLRPASAAEVTGGLWAERRRVNREVSIPSGWDRLHEAGNFHNLQLAAGQVDGPYVSDLPFLDSDVYKWVEAVSWALADPELDEIRADRLRRQLGETERLLRRAQEPDGYLDSHFSVRFPGERFEQLAWGHELYCAGHLIQAAVALHRTTGQEGLLEVARRVADLVVTSFGTEPGRVDGVCGHPEIESALVELYRETGEASYLGRARYFIDRRGHGLLGEGRFGPPTGRTTSRSGTRRRCRAMRSASCTCWPGSPTSPWRPATHAPGRGGAAVERDGRHQDLPDRWDRRAPQRRGLRRLLRAAQRAQLLRDLRGHRLDHVLLADADDHRRGPVRRPAGTHALQRLPGGVVPGRPALHLREPAAGPRGPPGARHRRGLPAGALVPVCLLPAQRDADPGVAGALCAARRRPARRPAPVPDRALHRRHSGRPGHPAGADRLPVGRRGERHRRGRAGGSVRGDAAGPGLGGGRRAQRRRGVPPQTDPWTAGGSWTGPGRPATRSGSRCP